jgi:capsular exopolysaccharide synthesis family protein
MDIQTSPANGGRSSSAGRFLDQVHRYKRLLAGYWWLLLLTTGLSLWIGWMEVKREPQFFVSTGRMTLSVKLSIPNATYYSEEMNSFFGTQVELMESDTIRSRVTQRLQAQIPPLHPVPVFMQVSVSPRANIFNLRAEGLDPDYVRLFLQATMEEYVKLKRELLENASSTTKSSLEKERELMAAKLAESKTALFNYQSSNSVVFLQRSGGNDAADYLASLNRELAERKSELQLLKTLTLDENLERQQGAFSQSPPAPQPLPQHYSSGQNQPEALNAGAPPAARAAQSMPEGKQLANNAGGLEYRMPNTPGASAGFEAAYLQAKQQIVLLKAQRDELSQYMRPKHPDIIALDEEIARQQRLLEIFQEQSQEQLRNHQHIVEAEVQDLEIQIKEWELKAVEASKKLSAFEALKENCNRLQTICDQLQGALQTLDVNKGIGQETVAIFEPATPGKPAPGKAQLHMATAAIIGIVLGAGILLLLNQINYRPGSSSELEELLGEPVLGQIPFLKGKEKKNGVPLIQMDDDRHLLVESYSNLRSALLFKDLPENHSKSIVVTSAAPGEGKSMVCANLAISLAQAGARVLLVDADLRRGQLHKRFSVPDRPGLAEVLAEQCDWSEAVVHTSTPNLDLLPCGKPPRRPASLLVSRTKKILKQMDVHYDYFLFDSAPVMAADDVSSLAPQVGGILMVIRAGSTYGRIAKSALDLLYLRKVNVIGLVFNAVSPNARDYNCYHYKEYFMKDQPQ